MELVLVAYFPDEELARAKAAATLSDRYHARLEHLIGDEWRDNWRRFFRPTRIGPRLVIRSDVGDAQDFNPAT